MRSWFVLLSIVFLIVAVSARRPYDYVIVGGGAAGSLIANRLSANPDNDVLVIDIGTASCPACDANLGANLASSSPYGTFPLPIEQQYLKFVRQPSLYQYHGIGGSTKSFGGVHTMPSRQFLDSYFPPGYRYDDLLPNIKATQDHYCHYLPQSITGISPADCISWHGKGGEMQSVFQSPSFHGPAMTALGAYLGTRPDVGNTTDLNNPNLKRGFGWEQRWSRQANKSDLSSPRSRNDAQIGFLPPSLVASRPNLDFLLNTRVTRLLSLGTYIWGVEVLVGGTDLDIIRARKHIFVCGGVLETPKLLELSGIGQPAVLAQYGIRLVANNSAVGANLRSHQALIVSFRTKNVITPDLTKSTYNAAHIFLNISGDNTRANNFQVELLNGFYVENVEGAANGLPDAIAQGFLSGQGSFPYMAAEIEHHAPSVLGSVHIQSANPVDPPRYDFGWGFNLFAAPDVPRFLQAIALVRDIFTGNNSFAQQYIEEEVWPGNKFRDFYIKQGITQEPLLTTLSDTLALQNAMTHFYHITGTCALGQCTNLDGEVRGVQGVSVCDNSILPENPDGNPTTTLFGVCDKIVKIRIAKDAASRW